MDNNCVKYNLTMLIAPKLFNFLRERTPQL